MIPPKVDSTERDALTGDGGGVVPAGAMIYNITTNKLQVYNGSGWDNCN